MITSYRESLELLKLQPRYSAEQLKSAYRKAAHKYHPDKGGDVEKFKQVKAAYEFLQTYQLPAPPKQQFANVTMHVYNGGYTITYTF